MMNSPIAITVKDIAFYERDVTLRMPFRFGIVTLREAPQIFVKVTIENNQGRRAEGFAAEVLAPKWFDKNPDLSNEDNFQQLRDSTNRAREFYLASPATTPFLLFAENYAAQMAVVADQRLVASFGQALLDRAVLDAVCRMDEISFYQAIQGNRPGLTGHPIAGDLDGWAVDDFLGTLSPANDIHARHTVGMVDPLRENPEPVDDGLPETLEQVIAVYGHRYFKIKVGGEVDADIQRLTEIAAILDQSGIDYRLSLDGNEQYPHAAAFVDFFERMETEKSLQNFCERILFIEQPISRSQALAQDVSPVSNKRPIIIDESDNDLDAFPTAMALGYQGVSTKSCKGLYKSLINLARCQKAGAGFFLSAEDLTMQAGIGVQQDLALVSLLGLRHVERNGHHYVNGLADIDRSEQLAYLTGHPGLYHEEDGVVRLRITNGKMDISSLGCVGFASNVLPNINEMTR
jgi:hypothetical protein